MATQENNGVAVTLRDAIHAGLILGLGQNRTLDIWRELGGQIRDADFGLAWKQEVTRFKDWSRNWP